MRLVGVGFCSLLAACAACSSSGSSSSSTPQSTVLGPVVTYGQKYEGGEFHLGPVDWEETKFHNACAPGTKYAPAIRTAQGDLLAGLWGGIPNVAQYCDACILVTTARGNSALLRVVTYGDTTTNSIDVSAKAFELLDSGEYPRSMTWQLAKCPDVGKIAYEFQTGSSEYWTSLWVRKARVPIKKVEVKSVNHASYVELTRGTDGTLTDAAGFGKGAFSIRITGVDDQDLVDAFEWPASGVAGRTLESKGNLQ
jgi:expansin